MCNRVNRYYVNEPASDIRRARETMAFCSALIRIGDPGDFASWELDTIRTMQAAALAILNKYGLTSPGLAPKQE
jgi:hypothetical protein